MNAAALVSQRLKGVGMLADAERASKRTGLRLADCLEPGDGRSKPTPGHVAVWQELARLGNPEDQIATIVDWPAATVRRAVRGEAEPPAATLSKADVAAAVRKAVGPLEERVSRLTEREAVLRTALNAAAEPLRARVAELRKNLAAAKRTEVAADPDKHLARYGRAGALVREMCAESCVPIDDLLAGRRFAHVSACRAAIIERLSRGDLGDGQVRRGWSSTAIGAVLCLDHTTILYHLGTRGRKAAA